jgi:hypothetical protein
MILIKNRLLVVNPTPFLCQSIVAGGLARTTQRTLYGWPKMADCSVGASSHVIPTANEIRKKTENELSINKIEKKEKRGMKMKMYVYR